MLNRDDIQYLLELVNKNPDYFLDEMLHLLQTNRFISVHFQTIYQELQNLNVSRKRLQRIAIERDETHCALFISCEAFNFI
jgi:uncharacterized protein Yka (UPF0111/DUF47 family)